MSIRFIVRMTHWLNAIALFVLIPSGLRIFRAFPSFGPKIPQEDLLAVPPAADHRQRIGGRAAMALYLYVDLRGLGARCIWLINSSAATTSKSCSRGKTFPASGLWRGIISSSALSPR